MLPDVQAMLDAHAALNPIGQGRRNLGHITKGGVLLLCAAWELYVEELLKESVTVLLDRANQPNDLPLAVRKKLAKLAKSGRNELDVLRISGDGWKPFLLGHLDLQINSFNTPKKGPVDELFASWIGFSKLSSSWEEDNQIDEFVRVRGEIAHRGADCAYITKTKLNDFKVHISETVKRTDDAVVNFLTQECGVFPAPWRRTR